MDRDHFLRHALQCGALRFGNFRLKSGRESPYFFDLGAFADGAGLALLGECCAGLVERVQRQGGLRFELLFGTAYKGIPLLVAAALSLQGRRINLPWAFNRKEPKRHGEGGGMVGAPLQGQRVLILDDVLTAGTAVREAVAALRDADAHPVGLAVMLDRRERGASGKLAARELEEECEIPVFALATLDDLFVLLSEPEQVRALQRYREQYSAS